MAGDNWPTPIPDDFPEPEPTEPVPGEPLPDDPSRPVLPVEVPNPMGGQ